MSAPPGSPTTAVVPSDERATPEPKPVGSATFVSFAVGATRDCQACAEGAWKTYTAARSVPTAPAATRMVVPSPETATAARFTRAEAGTRSLALGLAIETQ